ncbi:MAG TPA: hypothetical protein VJ063_05985 [Verrucomicrobiae bacterium]|nr:hypothetical protein [Verrucomicrobiae bacterium]
MMTLIMLSVITVVAVAFLALSQRERTAVTQSTQQTEAEIMADAGLERAKAEIVTRIIAANTNLNAVDLLVSLNYIRTNGFISPQTAPIDTLNVNYEYRVGGAAGLNATEREQNIANLYYDPRVPVFVNTNVPGGPQGPLDFRFYLDLNRNGRYDTNGAYPLIDDKGNAIPQTDYHFVGDPEWVGVLENPLASHSRTNRFIGRYAFIVLPIGKSLDINYIYNHAKRAAQPDEDGFLRNQGVGPWELNLAAFLADLNTNVWNPIVDNYIYRTNVAGIVRNDGVAFRDALAIYTTRFGSFQNVAPAQQLFGAAEANFNDGFVDHYSDGPLYITAFPPVTDDDNASIISRLPWPGSFACVGTLPRKNFFTPHDFFEMVQPRNPALPADTFTNRLYRTGFANASYDRYTFYRMLAQLSTDSASELPFANIPQLQSKISASNNVDFICEPAGKINLHFNNLDYPITSMVPWGSDLVNGKLVPGDTNRFFNAVADVLLRSQFKFGVSNIYVTNYNVTVHRLLQVAANIHESLHNSSNAFPAIFRPNVITDPAGRYLISGYYHDADAGNLNAWIPRSAKMPMLVGTRKGLPNFNEYVAETIISAARKLEMRRLDTNSSPYQTNEMFILGIDNQYALEAWNSYVTPYSNKLDIAIANNLTISITNNDGFVLLTNRLFSVAASYNTWPGFVKPTQPSYVSNAFSFKVPLYTNNITLSNGIYRGAAPGWIEPVGDTNKYIAPSGFRTPEWNLTVSNDLVFVLQSGNRIVDFVHLSLTNTLGLTTNFFNPNAQTPGFNEGQVALCWSTNRRGNATSIYVPTDGVQRQIDISLDQVPIPSGDWKDFANVKDDRTAITNFQNFVFHKGDNTNLITQVPFTPARKMLITSTWEVNDPLVHYMEEHIRSASNFDRKLVKPFFSVPMTNQNTLWVLNRRYQPWGGRPGQQHDAYYADARLKDPGVRKSDDWDFPTNQVPSVGWLGRIHRGTPWQTVYMKSKMASLGDWAKFSLDPLSHPTNDWRLIDVFTTAVHPNASHGQLSINQTNFAAWSAALGGVINLSNLVVDVSGEPVETFIPVQIDPSSSQLLTIYEGIQKVREKMPDKTFRRLGDLLRVPELSDGSPWINGDTSVADPEYGLSDWMLERLPQQLLSLLKVGDPRYVIYAWGQSLRPAENSILSSGTYMGMCTNYQVTGEFVTRTVFQIEGTAGQPLPTAKGFNILSSD